MIRYILKRLVWMIPVVLGVIVIVFSILRFCPGDPAEIIAGAEATQEQVDGIREAWGLDKPFFVQLVSYIENVLTGDFGKSYLTNVSVTSELAARIPRTLGLAFACMVISVIVGVPLGIIAAVKQNSWADRVCMLVALIGVSMPNFWLALLLVLLFSVKLGWLPAMGIGGVQYYIMPAIAGSMQDLARQARQARSSMLEEIRADYVITARAKGLSEKKVILKHALKNALIPVITVAGNGFGSLLGGALILETIFQIPGVGLYIISAVSNRDYPIVQGGTIFLAIAFSFIMLAVDLIYASVDPRIRAQYTGGKRRKKHA
ncbi:ABC transporter permease [Ruminococcus sp. OA3]|uniref:ABC transporter permease n=1 Tax=Ruminococcus sp. OA3 TaxID=2914164 RepID=UPI001F05D40A|nr:ABC transporter permease [Ruminococcus sp. OA3]MCH1982039.1 ABC transporter permease [Ruminococcus sp. OA3]